MKGELPVSLLSHERVDDLQKDGLFIIQSDDQFSFSTDAVLLSHFAAVKHVDRVIDLGTGSGVIPLLLFARYQPKYIVGLEIQDFLADRARRSVALNGLTDHIDIVKGDINDCGALFSAGSFDAVVTNPPYRPVGHGEQNHSDAYRIAKHEVLVDLEGVAEAACYLLRDKGKCYMVHRSDRLAEIFSAMSRHHLEPKILRMVHSREEKDAHLCLIMAMKQAKPSLKVLPPLVIYGNGQDYTEEIKTIYYGF